jgi:hypothetical protein
VNGIQNGSRSFGTLVDVLSRGNAIGILQPLPAFRLPACKFRFGSVAVKPGGLKQDNRIIVVYVRASISLSRRAKQLRAKLRAQVDDLCFLPDIVWYFVKVDTCLEMGARLVDQCQRDNANGKAAKK